jgi:hypothetical protein
MQMFVLLGVTRYEGDTLLGVYTTAEAAYRAYEVYCETHTPYDRAGVEPVTVDVPAEAHW